MAIKDIKNQLVLATVLLSPVSSNTTVNGASIDTADFDEGLVFGVSALGVTDGDYALSFEESDTGAFGGEETAIPAAKLLGDNISIDASYSTGDAIPTQGVIGNKRYIRAVITSTNVTTGASQVLVHHVRKSELVPV